MGRVKLGDNTAAAKLVATALGCFINDVRSQQRRFSVALVAACQGR
jgi:hypothetical protein